jgi:uracil-DNA glycosylase family 4
VTRDPVRNHLELERMFGADFLPTTGGVASCGEDEFEGFRRDVLGCVKCRLAEGRTQVVFGVGPLDSPVVLVGEGPGEEEDRLGEPFVGRAGRLLTKTIEKLGVRREQVYIANIVKCRPPGNRRPELDEIQSCIPYLFRQIARIRPKLVCAMGAVAAGALLNRPNIAVLKARGKFETFHNLRLFITVHPSYCLRNPPDARLLEEDLRTVFEEGGLLARRSFQNQPPA